MKQIIITKCMVEDEDVYEYIQVANFNFENNLEYIKTNWNSFIDKSKIDFTSERAEYKDDEDDWVLVEFIQELKEFMEQDGDELILYITRKQHKRDLNKKIKLTLNKKKQQKDKIIPKIEHCKEGVKNNQEEKKKKEIYVHTYDKKGNKLHEFSTIEDNDINRLVYSQWHHFGIACNICSKTNFNGARYRCTTCDNFDMCQVCEADDMHDPTHVLMKIKKPVAKNDCLNDFSRKPKTLSKTAKRKQSSIEKNIKNGCCKKKLPGRFSIKSSRIIK